RLVEEGVDHGRLAGVELAGDHQQEEGLQALAGVLEQRQVLRVGREGADGGDHLLDDAGRALAQLLLAASQDALRGSVGDVAHARAAPWALPRAAGSSVLPWPAVCRGEGRGCNILECVQLAAAFVSR